MSLRVAALCVGMAVGGFAAGAAGGVFAWRHLNPPARPRPDVLGSAPPEAEAPPVNEPAGQAPPGSSAPGAEFFGFAVGATAAATRAPKAASPGRSAAAEEAPPRTAERKAGGGPAKLAFMKDKCVAGFDATSNLHDFSGWTRDVTGTIEFDRARIAETARASVTVDARSLNTGVAARDRDMQATLESAKFPKMTFELASAQIQGERMTMRGAMKIHGVTQNVEIPCTLRIRKDGFLYVKGELRTKLTSFGITPPVNAGVLRVADDIRIWFEAWAQPVGSGS